MQTVSEIIKRGSFGAILANTTHAPTIDHKCDNCGKIHQTGVTEIRGKSYSTVHYCPECRDMVKATGVHAEFNHCHRCGKCYIVADRRGWSETMQFCADCVPTVAAELAVEERQRHADSFAQICPPLYRNTDPARLPAAQHAKVMAWQYGATGLLLHGETGKCKTRCAWLRLQKFHIEEQRRFVWFDSVSFSHAITKHFGPDGKSERWLDEVNNAALVFLDDLGKCRLTERGEAELFGIVESRMANMRPIIATTNFVGTTLAGGLRPDIGSALVRRLRECCDAIAF